MATNHPNVHNKPRIGRTLALATAIALVSQVPAQADRRRSEPTVSIADAAVIEGTDTFAEFRISVDSRPSGDGVSVHIRTQDQTASADSDYGPLEQTLTFSRRGSRTQSIRVPIKDDGIHEPTETFAVVIEEVSGGTIGNGVATGTITDDDSEPLNNAPTANDDNATTKTGIAVDIPVLANDKDADGDSLSLSSFSQGTEGAVTDNHDGTLHYLPRAGFSGSDHFTYTITDGNGGYSSARVGITVMEVLPPPDSTVSINSHATPGLEPMAPVAERARVTGNGYSVFGVNDLGMHCVDLDGRIANILPPFQVLLTQVIRKGAEPELNPKNIELFYSAASNPNDPILSSPAAFSGASPDGTIFKSNFWEMIDRGAWEAFYPPVFDQFKPDSHLKDFVGNDEGLLVPNAEELYIGADDVVDKISPVKDGELLIEQQFNPGHDEPRIANDPQPMPAHYRNKPFFIDFPIGYVAEEVNWYEAAGIPMSPFDDAGRQNPFPLVRVEARDANNTVVSTSDVVLPVSAETSCSNCHGAVVDVPERLSTLPLETLAAAGLPVEDSTADPLNGKVPAAVSIEYAADINILRLHDLKHGAQYVSNRFKADGETVEQFDSPCNFEKDTSGQIRSGAENGNDSCLINRALVQNDPVICQQCHYTPALDLAQVGPVAGPAGSEANGRNQLAHESNSRVMHNHHGALEGLFPPIPPAEQNPITGEITNQLARTDALEQNCYQCHPGKDTQCLRGAMFNGGILCSDCHGTMENVGADFTAGVSPSNPGAFVLDRGNFYNALSKQPRVPWANEPGCGSCHTGDANSNLANMNGVMVNHVDGNGVSDGIRLRQAFVTGDDKATPIVPTNKRFAEPAVPASFNGFDNPNAGNPQLYRVSTGHGGVMCEGCHGATHAEWPVADHETGLPDPNSNDNQLAIQMQGHAGPILECSACHNTSGLSSSTLGGPHGMHLVNDSRFYREGHKDLAKRENGKPGGGSCGSCHGADHLGTVLSRTPVDRRWSIEDNINSVVAAGEPVGCNVCHSLSKSFGR